jgi:acetyl/propionyl-CoA carboxylase alpha subunit
MKTLNNTTANQAKDQVSDIQFWGNGDTFKLISKASSKNEGWMKSTKAMEIEGVGCVVQVTTQQRSPDGQNYSIAEAVTFIPGVKIEEQITAEQVGTVTSRKLVKI